MQVPATAAITETTLDSGHVKLSLTLDIEQAGYLFANVSHDAAENVDVYFAFHAGTTSPSPKLTGI